MGSKRSATKIILIHLVIVWLAVVVRVDRFPLTWVPMYSVYKSKTPKVAAAPSPNAKVAKRDQEFSKKPKRIKHKDRDRLEIEGWQATRRDGSTFYINRGDINVPWRNMWRLYYERTFGKGPPKYKHMNRGVGTWDRWLWGLEPGEDFYTIDWRRRLLVSINKTYALHPEDPAFIIALGAYYDATLIGSEGNISVAKKVKKSTALWDDAWSENAW